MAKKASFSFEDMEDEDKRQRIPGEFEDDDDDGSEVESKKTKSSSEEDEDEEEEEGGDSDEDDESDDSEDDIAKRRRDIANTNRNNSLTRRERNKSIRDESILPPNLASRLATVSAPSSNYNSLPPRLVDRSAIQAQINAPPKLVDNTQIPPTMSKIPSSSAMETTAAAPTTSSYSNTLPRKMPNPYTSSTSSTIPTAAPAEAPPQKKSTSESKLWKRMSGTLLPMKKKDDKQDKKKLNRNSIGAPTNFVHVQTIKTETTPAVITTNNTFVSPAVAAAMQEANNSHDGINSGEQPPLAPIKKKITLKGSASTESMDSLFAENVGAALNSKDIDDLLDGSYFLRHTDKEMQQRYISCSDDLRFLLLWNSFHDKSDKKTPKESIPTKDILTIKVGYQTPTFEKTGVDGREELAFSIVIANNRTLDLEAFTEEERAKWLSRFQVLMGFLKQKI